MCRAVVHRLKQALQIPVIALCDYNVRLTNLCLYLLCTLPCSFSSMVMLCHCDECMYSHMDLRSFLHTSWDRWVSLKVTTWSSLIWNGLVIHPPSFICRVMWSTSLSYLSPFAPARTSPRLCYKPLSLGTSYHSCSLCPMSYACYLWSITW